MLRIAALASVMSEKLLLKWNDFQENLNGTFGSLRNNTDFVDVTLACEDGQQVEAHKVVLAASSPFFQNLFKMSKHPHPLIYMRGVKSDDLVAIIDFLYCGEANVKEDNLNSFLAIAEELKLKGLMGHDKEVDKNVDNPPVYNMSKTPHKKQPIRKYAKSVPVAKIVKMEENSIETAIAIPFTSGVLEDLDDQVKSMMEKSQNLVPSGKRRADTCKVCGKEGETMAIKDHIEAKHLEGICIPCNACEKTFRSRYSLRMHRAKCQN